ncbi:helix-turn-helix transcriptional regulator [Chromobacterium violaceum]|uniref:helix-turn-helix transcriptional regulator n=1 Tax=Chromobacterium violaceum TaxID=536 RepID=UPI00143D362E|nr:helix-turn-helix transcriptional regulator [Chromobacterium violaceum]QIY81484.1 helix-turn-helix transcriptional regulator [Chromobacterium violaceum]
MARSELFEINQRGSSRTSHMLGLFDPVLLNEGIGVHSERIASCYSYGNGTLKTGISKLRVPSHSNLQSNAGMENNDIRRANLNLLIDEFKTIRALADQVETAPNYISEIKNGIRNMGHKLARKIEEKTGKPVGWLDQLHTDPSIGSAEPIVAKDLDELAQVVGGMDTEQLHAFISKALAHAASKKAS